MSGWLPALDGVVDKLERGARVADVGCGHGASTVSWRRVHQLAHSGYDYHGGSIEFARSFAERVRALPTE